MELFLTIALPSIAALYVGYLLHGGAKWTETQAFGQSIAREILLITRKLETYEEELKRFRDDLESVVGEKILPIPLTDSDMIVFNSNTDKVGLLEPGMSLIVLKFYQQTRDLITESQNNWDGEAAKWANEGIPDPLWYGFFYSHINRVSEMIAYITPRMFMIDAWVRQPYWKKLFFDFYGAVRTKKPDDNKAA